MTFDFKVTKFDPNKPVPIIPGFDYPGIILCFGIPYEDPNSKPPHYRIGPASVGFNTAVWVDK